MTKKSDKDLLQAVLEPRKKGALKQIAAACAAGADPNAICPEGSTSRGHIRPGNTLLTHSIHEWASRAVQKLLECGADPNLEDENGWTPWMASTVVDESKQDRIQKSLLEFGARRDGDHIGQLVRAVYDGDVEQASKLIKSDDDMKVISNFRIDLVGHQIANGNPQMLELLLARNMVPTSTNLLNAVRSTNLPALDVLLRSGMPPERPDSAETPLMTAAAIGDLKVVQRLVEAGADVNRSDPDSVEWTASFYARKAGKKEVANWLTMRMKEALLEKQDQAMGARDKKYRLLYEQATAGEGQSTDEIVETLKRWDESFGIDVEAASGDSVTIGFSSLPDNLGDFYKEAMDVCPDVAGTKSTLEKELTKNKKLFLWWD